MPPFTDEAACSECGNDIEYPTDHDGSDGKCVDATCGAKFVLVIEEDGTPWSNESAP